MTVDMLRQGAWWRHVLATRQQPAMQQPAMQQPDDEEHTGQSCCSKAIFRFWGTMITQRACEGHKGQSLLSCSLHWAHGQGCLAIFQKALIRFCFM